MSEERYNIHQRCTACRVVIASAKTETVCPQCGGPVEEVGDGADAFAARMAEALIAAAGKCKAMVEEATLKFPTPLQAALAHLLVVKIICEVAPLPFTIEQLSDLLDATKNAMKVKVVRNEPATPPAEGG